MPRLICYLAGPISNGGKATQEEIQVAVMSGIDLADAILDEYGKDVIPFIPHLSWWWDLRRPKSHQEWLDYDFDILHRCDILYRMPGASKGADMEVEFMGSLLKPVVYSMEQLGQWLASAKKSAA